MLFWTFKDPYTINLFCTNVTKSLTPMAVMSFMDNPLNEDRGEGRRGSSVYAIVHRVLNRGSIEHLTLLNLFTGIRGSTISIL